MAAKHSARVLGLAALVCLLALAAGSCQRGGGGGEGPDLTQLYGTGFKDLSEVLCKVGDITITRAAFEKRYEELPPRLKARYTGEGWEKRFLRFLVDEALQAQAALDRKLQLRPEVSQQLISQRRAVLVAAFREWGLEGVEAPTEQQIRDHYQRMQSQYRAPGTLRARHIQCRDEQTAREVHARLRQGGPGNEFVRLVAAHSTNQESAKQGGDLGWFDRGGFIPALTYGQGFSQRIWDFTHGLNEPVEFGGHWHVVEVTGREPERQQTLDEVRDQIIEELKPLLKEERLRAYLLEARRRTPIEYAGPWRPGAGRGASELFKSAWLARSPEQQLDTYEMILEDFPESDLVDDTLFMLANLYLDHWGDVRQAGLNLDRLLREFPDSEYAAQARFMLENMGKQEFRKPQSIEDLRRLTR